MIREFKLWNYEMTNNVSFNNDTTYGIFASDIKGLGTRYDLKMHDKEIYDQDLNFEPITMRLNFLVSSYTKYNNFKTFLYNNGKKPFVLEYMIETNKPRYCDVYVESIPRSEKTNFKILSEVITFTRLTLWYELLTYTASFVATYTTPTITNATFIDCPVIIKHEDNNKFEITVNNDIASLEVLETVDDIIINSQNKTVISSTGVNLYHVLNKTKDTFLYIPNGNHTITITYAAANGTTEIIVKKWVVD